jgi:hypothetical protein
VTSACLAQMYDYCVCINWSNNTFSVAMLMSFVSKSCHKLVDGMVKTKQK